MRSRYYWEGLYTDCILVTKSQLPSQVERAKFKPPPYLFPTEKGDRPLVVWSLDCIVGLSPPAPDGATACVVGTCAFSKFVEVARITSVDSY